MESVNPILIEYGKVFIAIDPLKKDMFIYSHGQLILIPWYILTNILPVPPITSVEEFNEYTPFFIRYYSIGFIQSVKLLL